MQEATKVYQIRLTPSAQTIARVQAAHAQMTTSAWVEKAIRDQAQREQEEKKPK